METNECDGLFFRAIDRFGGAEKLLEGLFEFFNRRTDFYSDAERANDIVQSSFMKYKHKKTETQTETQTETETETETSNLKCLNLPSRESDLNGNLDNEYLAFKTPSSRKGDRQVHDSGSTISSRVLHEETPAIRPNNGNGYETDRYVWSQSLDSLECAIPLNQKISKQQMKVVITSSNISINAPNFVFEMEFCEKIKPDESFWTLVNQDTVQITAEKNVGAHWWSSCFTNEPQLDSSRLVPENSKLSDLDGETRQTVEKMLFDQRQKQLGLPSSEELKHKEIIEKLKMQNPKLDFSKVKFS